MTLHIATLGHTRVLLDGRDVDWLTTHRRRVALLLYLALEGAALREKLLGMLWPESDPERARHSLNQLIYTLRKCLGEETLVTNGEQVALARGVEVDAAAFARAVTEERYDDALPLYRGGFLRDVVLSDSPQLEHWAEQHRARLARLHRKARRAVLDQLDGSASVTLAHQWIEIEPEDDEAQHRYLELLIRTGQRSRALKHYASYEKLLAADGLTPLEETRALMAGLHTPLPPAAAAVVADHALPVAAPGSTMDEPAHMPWLGRLIADLKRRHVLRVMAVYALMCWGAVEVSDSAFSADWVPRLVLELALLAAPLVLVCAWYFDITPRGIRRTPR